ncbi:MAG: hypothetical protein U0531_04355 [Dehalococcoidia bacterium]
MAESAGSGTRGQAMAGLGAALFLVAAIAVGTRCAGAGNLPPCRLRVVAIAAVPASARGGRSGAPRTAAARGAALVVVAAGLAMGIAATTAGYGIGLLWLPGGVLLALGAHRLWAAARVGAAARRTAVNKGLLGVGRPMTVSEARYLQARARRPGHQVGTGRRPPAKEAGNNMGAWPYRPQSALASQAPSDRSRWEVVPTPAVSAGPPRTSLSPTSTSCRWSTFAGPSPRPGMVAYPEPVSLVVEVWSRRMGRYDGRTSWRRYKRRGDPGGLAAPSLRAHLDRVAAPDGSYVESASTAEPSSPSVCRT